MNQRKPPILTSHAKEPSSACAYHAKSSLSQEGDNQGMRAPVTSTNLNSLPQNGISRRRALALLGYGGLAAAAGMAGFWGWRKQEAASARNFSHHPLYGLQLQNLDGSALKLPTFLDGRPLLLNFWAPWCPPCVEELPRINAQYAALPHKNFQILAIALDDLDKVQSFWRNHALSAITPAVAGYAGMSLMRRLGNSSGQLPYTVLLAADGAILQQHLGALKTPDISSLFAIAQKAEA